MVLYLKRIAEWQIVQTLIRQRMVCLHCNCPSIKDTYGRKKRSYGVRILRVITVIHIQLQGTDWKDATILQSHCLKPWLLFVRWILVQKAYKTSLTHWNTTEKNNVTVSHPQNSKSILFFENSYFKSQLEWIRWWLQKGIQIYISRKIVFWIPFVGCCVVIVHWFRHMLPASPDLKQFSSCSCCIADNIRENMEHCLLIVWL